LASNDADVLEFKVGTDSKATYSIDYISGILKALGGVTDTVQLEFSTKKPIRLEMKLNDQGAKLWYFLAPRVAD
jgi:proliferating cell nuclear antigen